MPLKKCSSGFKEKNHFISLIFTLWASRRLPYAALLRPGYSLPITLPLNALHIKPSGSCNNKLIILYIIKTCLKNNISRSRARRKPIQKALFRAYTLVLEHFESVLYTPLFPINRCVIHLSRVTQPLGACPPQAG